jgi:hypothetical protein
VISSDFQVRNPENFNYLYDGHGSFNKMMQKLMHVGKNISYVTFLLNPLPVF